jgi:signal transduction histidine kinase
MNKKWQNTIMSSGRNLLALIYDIIDLSRIESGKMNIQMEPMECSVVIYEIQQVLKQKLEAKNLAFNISIDASVPAYVFMDEIRFYQILFNIISNALKFTDKGYISSTCCIYSKGFG